MNKKAKTALSRMLAVVLALNMIMGLVITADLYYGKENKAEAAEEGSGLTSDVMGTTSDKITNLEIGKTYELSDCEWMVAEKKEDYAVLVMTKGNKDNYGTMGGYWPGYVKNGNSYYSSSVEGEDISSYYVGLGKVYNNIKSAEYSSASYGKGLYLVPSSYVNSQTGFYCEALKTAAINYSSFGASNYCAWLGTVYGSNYACYVNSGGSINSGHGQNYSYAVAPAFNLSLSKAMATDDKIYLQNDLNDIDISQSISIVFGNTNVDLNDIIEAVTYTDDFAKGKKTNYIVKIPGSGCGSIKGTIWTTPEVDEEISVSLTVIEQFSGKKLTETIKVIVKPSDNDASDYDESGNGFRTSKVVYTEATEDTDEVAINWNYKYDKNGNVSYLYTEDDPSPIVNSSGTLIVPSSINGRPVVGIGGGAINGEIFPFVPSTGNTWTSIYIPSSVTRINAYAFCENDAAANIVIPENVTEIGELAFYKSKIMSLTYNGSYEDGVTTTIRKFAFQDTALCQTDEKKTDTGVIIRGGDVEVSSNAFKNARVKKVTIDTTKATIDSLAFNECKSLEELIFGGTDTDIKETAFSGCTGLETITFQSTNTTIGKQAFANNTGVTDIYFSSDTTAIDQQAFAGCTSLKNLTFNGTTVVAQKAFSGDTGIEWVDIPKSTTFVETLPEDGGTVSDSEADTYVFADTTGLKYLYIDIADIPSNLFSGNKSLSKVVFGENVESVVYNWAGTSSLSSGADRHTYVLSDTTMFTMYDNKSDSIFSPLGYNMESSLHVTYKEGSAERDTKSSGDGLYKYNITYLAQKDCGDGTDEYNRAKGQASSIIYSKPEEGAELSKDNCFTFTDETSGSETALKQDSKESSQTNIEAYYKNALFYNAETKEGDTLDKDDMNVYRISNGVKGDKYSSNEYYVLRSEDATKLLYGMDNSTSLSQDEETGAWYYDTSKIGEKDTNVLEAIKNADSISLTADDYANGELSVTVVVLKTDRNGNALVDHDGNEAEHANHTDGKGKQSQNCIMAYTSTFSIPVQAYSSEAVFTQKYGSYEKVISEINALTSDLNSQKSSYEAAYARYTELVEQMSSIISNTTIDTKNGGYTYTVTETVTGDDGETKEVTAHHMIAAGTEYTYDPDDVVAVLTQTTDDGSTTSFTIYTALDSEGNTVTDSDGKVFYFYVADDGIHKVILAETETEDGQKGYTIDGDAVISTSSDKIGVVQKQILNELGNYSKELDAVAKELDDIENMEGTAGVTFTEGSTTAEKITAIAEKIKELSNDYDTSTGSMQDAIKEINEALGGSGYEVCSIVNTDAETNGLPKTIYYKETKDGEIIIRTYLVRDEETGAFTEASDQTSYSEFDETEGTLDSYIGTKYSYSVNDTAGSLAGSYQEAMKDLTDALSNSENLAKENKEAADANEALAKENKETSKKLIDAVNEINGTNIELSDEATNEEIIEKAGEAVKAVNNQLTSLDSQNQIFASEYAELSKELNAILNTELDGTAEDAAEVTKAAKSALAELEALRKKIAAIDAAIDNLYKALEDAAADMGVDIVSTSADDDEASSADKINAVSGLVAIIQSSYNDMKEDYTALQSDYQTILNAVYGEDEKTASDVTAEEVAAQIESYKNSGGDLEADVNDTIDNAAALSAKAEEVQKDIAEAIETILEGGSVDTTALPQELQTALADIQTLQGYVNAIGEGSDEISAALSPIATALGLESTASAAEILASIKGLQAQVVTLTEENTSLKEQLASAGTGTVVADTSSYSTGYSTGYNAGYASGVLAASESVADNSTAATTLATQVSTLTETVNTLYEKNATLTAENQTLKSTVSTYETGIDEAYNEITTNSTGATTVVTTYAADSNDYVSKLGTIRSYYSMLSTNYGTLSTQNSTLAAKNETLTSTNEELKSENQTLTKTNKTLTKNNTMLATKNEKLTTKNKELKEKNSTLTSENKSLESQLASAKKSSSSSSSTKASNSDKASSNTASITVTGKESTKDEDSKDEEPTEEPETTEEPDTELVADEPAPADFSDDDDNLDNPNGGQSNVADVEQNTQTAETETKSSGSNVAILVLIVLVVLAMVGGTVYFLIIRPKQEAEDEDDEEEGEDDETV